MKKLEILEEKENPLFKRKEVKVIVEADVTPKNSEAGQFLSEKFSSPVENIKIKRILGKFGSHKFTISANIYSSKQDKEKIEPKGKKDKEVAEEKPTETQPVENKSEENKLEEVKSEETAEIKQEEQAG